MPVRRVGRKSHGFDLDPRRPDIKPWDISSGPPPVPEEPVLVFLDPLYACMKEGEYLPHPSQLGDMTAEGFLEAIGRRFSYWSSNNARRFHSSSARKESPESSESLTAAM